MTDDELKALLDRAQKTEAHASVLAERAKQIAKWGDMHDNDHDGGELATAAAMLADPESEFDAPEKYQEDEWMYRLGAKHRHDRRKMLVIATALLLAEIERLDRAEARR